MLPDSEAENPPIPGHDSSPLVNDPLRDIASPQVVLSYEKEDDIPFEIKEFLDAHGIPDRTYRCILKHLPEGWVDRATAPYIKSWANTFPTIEYVAKEYGPGEYILIFQWKSKDIETNKYKNFAETLPLFIDEHFRDEYEEHQMKKQIARSERQKRLVQSARLKSELNSTLLGAPDQPAAPDKIEAGKQYLKEIVDAGNMLGLSRRGVDWEKVLAIAVPLIPAFMEMLHKRSASESDKVEKIYTMLLAQQSESTRHLIELVKTQNGPNNGSDVMKEMRDMVFGAIDIKEALQGGKQSLGDKIFDLVQGVAPQVLEIAMKSKQAQEVDPRYHMAKAFMEHSPDFVKLRQEPAEQIKVVSKLDAFFGWEQADIILKVGGMERPAECPRSPEQRYPANDPRNAGASVAPQAQAAQDPKNGG